MATSRLFFQRPLSSISSSVSRPKTTRPPKKKLPPLDQHLKRRTRSPTHFDPTLYPTSSTHVPVMLSEVLSAFSTPSLLSFIDCTLGAAGHSSAILRAHPSLRLLLGLDIDPAALTAGRAALDTLLLGTAGGTRVHTHLGSFKHVKSALAAVDTDLVGDGVDGILMDLGVSSMQVNRSERGFSVMGDGPLDMRMNPQGVGWKDGEKDGKRKEGHGARGAQDLEGVPGVVSPGEMLVMMDLSGNDKTTLTSNVTYNNRPLSNSTKRNVEFVTQDDMLYPHFTDTETLLYTALLSLSNMLTRQEESAEVIVAQLGLAACRNNIIGGGLVHGVSGGERNRIIIDDQLSNKHSTHLGFSYQRKCSPSQTFENTLRLSLREDVLRSSIKGQTPTPLDREGRFCWSPKPILVDLY